MDCEKTDLSFPWRSAQARDPRRRTAFFGLDIIRHGLGDSEDGTGSERIFQVSSGTRRLGNQTGSVDQRQARTALRPGSEVSVLRVSSSTAETAELSGATQRHSGERHVRVGHHLRFPGCREVGIPPQSLPQGRKSSAPALIVVNYHFSARPSETFGQLKRARRMRHHSQG